MRITIITVRAVLSVVLLFPAIYQVIPDIIRSARILRTEEPDITHIPVKNMAAIARTPFFILLSEVNENLTAKINRSAIMHYSIQQQRKKNYRSY